MSDSRAWSAAKAWIVLVEAGYVDNPRDPGGETRWGISRRSHPSVDIAALTLEDAYEIYHREFWGPLSCEEMPPSWALAVFDAAILEGAVPAVRLLQSALGLTMDGALGQRTLAAIDHATRTEFDSFLWLRLGHMADQAAASTFMRGWARRLYRLRQECLGLGGPV